MPRSKFATKAYGPTKPKICENSILPPGVLPEGPARTLSAHFRLNFRESPVLTRPFVGAAILTQQSDPSRWIGTTYCGGYLVTITLTAAAPIWPPRFEWSFYKAGVTQWGSVIQNQFPRTVDPYDTGELNIAASGTDGRQMIRAVSLA